LHVSDLLRTASEPHTISPSEGSLHSSASERNAIASGLRRGKSELGQHWANMSIARIDISAACLGLSESLCRNMGLCYDNKLQIGGRPAQLGRPNLSSEPANHAKKMREQMRDASS
jgi:hypothetical protein